MLSCSKSFSINIELIPTQYYYIDIIMLILSWTITASENAFFKILDFYIGSFAHLSRREFVMSDTDVGKPAYNICSSSSQRCLMGLRSGPVCAGQSSSFTQNSPKRAFMDTALCSVVHSSWNRKGSSLFLQHCRHTTVQNVVVCWRVKLEQTISPSPNRYHSPGFSQILTHSSEWWVMENNDLPHHKTCFLCFSVQWWHALHPFIPYLALCSCLAMPESSWCTVLCWS